MMFLQSDQVPKQLAQNGSDFFDDMTGQRFCAPDDEDDNCTASDYDAPMQSVLAMSAGNALSALLGGFEGCGLISQTVLNVKSGGHGPLTPHATLVGIMMTVVYDTVAWGPTLAAIAAAIGQPDHPYVDGGVVSQA